MGIQLVILGAPGSGKGTQANLLVDKFKFCHISTGALLRDEIEKGSSLGKRITSIMNDGKLVDDKTVLELLKSNCDLDENDYVFDGYPRNLEQAEAFDKEIIEGRKYYAVYLDIDESVVVNRIINRRSCSICSAIYNLNDGAPQNEGICDKCGGTLTQRDDDTEAIIRNRLDVYNSTISDVVEYYKTKGVLKVVDASNGPERTFEEMVEIINI